MAGPSKRLRRKTTVSQKDLGVPLAVTLEYWVNFLIIDGLTMHFWSTTSQEPNWSRAKHLRIVNKQCRQVWDTGVQVKLNVLYGVPSDNAKLWKYDAFMVCAPWDRMRHQRKCLAYIDKNDVMTSMITMSWQAFIEMKPVLESPFVIVPCELLQHRFSTITKSNHGPYKGMFQGMKRLHLVCSNGPTTVQFDDLVSNSFAQNTVCHLGRRPIPAEVWTVSR